MTDGDITNLLENYRPSERAVKIVQAAKIVLLVGITGAGKNTLKKELLKDPAYYDYISHTTRAPRSNHGAMEQNGVDYFFISLDEAARMLEAGDFIEAKKVHSNVYGTAVAGLQSSVDKGTIAVNDVDVQGVEEYKAMSPTVHAIFLLPPSFDEWNRRRAARYEGDMQGDNNDLRTESAKAELAFALEKGYFDFVINDDLERAVRQVHSIVNGTLGEEDNSAAQVLARSLFERLSTH